MLELAILALFIFTYSLVAGRIQRSVISGPMVFVVAGFLLGPSALGWLKGNAASEDLRVLADLTLALVLFNDAALRIYPSLNASSRFRHGCCCWACPV